MVKKCTSTALTPWERHETLKILLCNRASESGGICTSLSVLFTGNSEINDFYLQGSALVAL